jgi:hypothetical protein
MVNELTGNQEGIAYAARRNWMLKPDYSPPSESPDNPGLQSTDNLQGWFKENI